jgi:hypothetical protein
MSNPELTKGEDLDTDAIDADSLVQQLAEEVGRHSELDVQGVILAKRTELTELLRPVISGAEPSEDAVSTAQEILLMLRGAIEANVGRWTTEAAHGSNDDLHAALYESGWREEISRDPLSDIPEEKLEEVRPLLHELLSELEELPRGMSEERQATTLRQLESTFAVKGGHCDLAYGLGM